MKGTASHLLEFLEGARKRFIIPVYQRNYDWKRDNCKQLFDDLVSVIRDGKQTHFFGSIVSYAHSRDEVILIDGQQRITTISLILIAMINAMRKGICVPNDSRLAEILEETYIVDKYRKEERKVRLKPFRDDCIAFDRLIYNDVSDYIQDSKVTINYNYFYDRIVQEHELGLDDLFKAIDSLEIIDIELEPEHGDNPQLIFESLNSTGLDLTEADKIRNFVLMNLAPSIQEQYYDKYWNIIEKCSGSELDSFVRNYLTIKTGVIPNLKKIYISFKEYAQPFVDIEAILQDMLIYAFTYRDLKTFQLGDRETNDIAKRLDLLDLTVAYPFLMAFLVYAKNVGLSTLEVRKVFSCIEIFIFRRLMCDAPTNALNKIFASLHSSVLKLKKEKDTYSEVIIYVLESKTLSSAFPKDDEFISGFTTKKVYSMQAKNKMYIFERLENGSSIEKNDVIENIKQGILTIEHIMPQNLTKLWKQELGHDWERIHEKWLHTISNLTLTGYNNKYSNRSFMEKRDMENGFRQSGLRLNHYIAQFEKWGEDEIEKRKAELSRLAKTIWPYPNTNFIPETKNDDIVNLKAYHGELTGRQIQYIIFQDERIEVTDWTDMIKEVINKLFVLNPDILYNEAKNDDNIWFTTEDISDKYKRIAEGLYFCPSKNTRDKMAILRILLRSYKIDENDLSFGLKPLKQ